MNNLEWISIKDRLPKRSGYYITFTDGKVISLHFAVKYGKFNVFSHFTKEEAEKCAIDVTHWMPLPEPPIEKEK